MLSKHVASYKLPAVPHQCMHENPGCKITMVTKVLQHGVNHPYSKTAFRIHIYQQQWLAIYEKAFSDPNEKADLFFGILCMQTKMAALSHTLGSFVATNESMSGCFHGNLKCIHASLERGTASYFNSHNGSEEYWQYFLPYMLMSCLI